MDSDDEIALPADTLALLNEFLDEKKAREEAFAKLQEVPLAIDTPPPEDVPITMEAFAEDWQQSQFWYTDKTQDFLGDALLEGVEELDRDVWIAVISAPSVYVRLLQQRAGRMPKNVHLVLFEYDRRFATFKKDFVFYDFNEPFKLPAEMKGRFERFLIDPPFLSEDTQTKVALTTRWLTNPKYEPKLLLCTGERMKELVCGKLYKKIGVKMTDIDVEHSQLQNEFVGYANWIPEDKRWKFVDDL